ncbi:MAG: uroporphyrinogen decarboxylase family protein [Spirochaetota bacterium]
MTSKERMLAAIECRKVDYVPCSFMLFFNLYDKCETESEFVEKQVELGLDAFAHVGYLEPSLHPDTRYTQWVEESNNVKYFCRRIDTPQGPLNARVRRREGWPTENDFPLMNDWIVPRAEEILVKPEKDLEKLPYLFGPFKDENIQELKATSREARRVADKHGLLLAGGWKGSDNHRKQVDPGVMGADAMAWLSGYEEIMVLSVTKPEIIKTYAEILHKWNMKQIEVYLDVTDPDIIIRRAWYETTEFWTPAAYREIIAPTIKKEAELVHQAGKKFGYIITSAFLPLLDDILDSNIDVLIGLDPSQGKGTEIHTVKKRFAERRKALWGGVSGAITIELGTEGETEEAVKAAIELGGNSGFILSPVDNVRENTEQAWKNTYKFIEAWKKYRVPHCG